MNLLELRTCSRRRNMSPEGPRRGQGKAMRAPGGAQQRLGWSPGTLLSPRALLEASPSRNQGYGGASGEAIRNYGSQGRSPSNHRIWARHGHIRPPSVAWQGHIRPHLWPGKTTSGPSVAWQGHSRPPRGQIRPPAGPGRPPAGPRRPPAGLRKEGFGPDPAGSRAGYFWKWPGGPRGVRACPPAVSYTHLTLPTILLV